jgi:hypothetical protein
VAAPFMTAFTRTAIAVVLGGGFFAYLYFVESKKEPTPATEAGVSAPAKREKVFTGFDKLKVRSIAIKQRSGDFVHAEKSGDSWKLTAPQELPADAGEIGMLLDALQGLESEEKVEAADLEGYGLKEPKVAISVVAEGAAKPFEFELGDNVPAGYGLFARVPGRPGLFTVSSTTENSLVKSAFDLRDRGILKVKKDDVQSFEVFEKNKTAFKVVRGAKGEDDWKLTTPVATRAARWTIDSSLGLIENLRMENIVTENATPGDLSKYGFKPAAKRVTLGLADGRTETLEVGGKADGGKYYARSAASNLVATISAGLADDLDKGLRNFRTVRLLDVAAYEVNGFDVIADGVTKTFTKTSTKGKDGVDQIVWKGAAPAKDATQEKVSDAMFAIGGLDASDFVDTPKAPGSYGLDAPAIRVVLRFEGDKPADWFEVGLKGDAAYARRRDDVAVLKLDKAKAEALIQSFASLGS